MSSLDIQACNKKGNKRAKKLIGIENLCIYYVVIDKNRTTKLTDEKDTRIFWE